MSASVSDRGTGLLALLRRGDLDGVWFEVNLMVVPAVERPSSSFVELTGDTGSEKGSSRASAVIVLTVFGFGRTSRAA